MGNQDLRENEIGEQSTASEGLEYRLSKDKTYYQIEGIGSCADMNVVIPQEYNGIPVKSIAPKAFMENEQLVSITIPESVIDIGIYAFLFCKNLTNINVAVDNAKYKSIGGNLYSKDGKTLIQYAIGKLDTDFEIPYEVENIETRAFSNCFCLEKVFLSNSVVSIGDHAFTECHGLKNVNIPEGLKEIEDATFAECENLEEIEIPNSVIKIGAAAFSSSGVKSVIMGEGVEIIGYGAFIECKNLVDLQIGENVTTIEKGAFAQCTALTKLKIPMYVKSIKDSAFSGCSSLANVIIVSDRASFGKFVFGMCPIVSATVNSAKSLRHLPKQNLQFLGVVKGNISAKALFNCNSLKGVVIRKGVKSIGKNAFNGCSNLEAIEIERGLQKIGAFGIDGKNDYKIFYWGTLWDWVKIKTNPKNKYGYDSRVYCYIENMEKVPQDRGKYWYFNENGVITWVTLT